MTFDAPTNAEKHVTSNDACSRCQRYTNDSIFLMVKMTLCVMMIRNSLPFVGPNVISNGPKNRLTYIV